MSRVSSVIFCELFFGISSWPSKQHGCETPSQLSKVVARPHATTHDRHFDRLLTTTKVRKSLCSCLKGNIFWLQDRAHQKKSRARKCQAHLQEHCTQGTNTMKNIMRWRAPLVHEGWSSEQQAAHAQRIATTLKQTQKTVEMSQADAPS